MTYMNRSIGAGCLIVSVISFEDFASYVGGTICCSSFGLVTLFFAFSSFGARMVVDPQGISRSHFFGLIAYRDEWDSLGYCYIEMVIDRETRAEDERIVFDFASRRWPFITYLGVFDDPGLVDELRLRVGSKERVKIANQAAENSGPPPT